MTLSHEEMLEEERRYDRDVLGIEAADGRAIPARRTRWNAAELLAEVFPDQRWAVPDVLAEGLNVLCGSPKVGKSWLALNIGVGVAQGGLALGRNVAPGEVLFLGLEDTPRRLQGRLKLMLTESVAPAALDIETMCGTIDAGGADLIEEWCAAHPERRLVVVDVWARVRGRSDPKATAYDADYLAASRLKDIADKYEVAVLLVHHTRKAGAEDWLDLVSGTQGLAGCSDAVLVLTRSRGSADAVLKVTGRDIDESEIALTFASDVGTWQALDGPARDYDLGDTRRRIVQLVRDTGPMTPKAIATALEITEDNTRQTVRRMVKADELDTDGSGNYFEPLSPVTPVTAVTSPGRDSDISDRSDTPTEHDRARDRCDEGIE